MIPLQDYRAYPAVNVSTLKQLYNPRWIKWRLDNPDAEDEEKSHFRVGGAIDTLMTNKDEFNNLYVVEDMDRPRGLMGIFIDHLPLHITDFSHPDEYEEAYIRSGYVIPRSLVIKRFWENQSYVDYFMSRKRSQGKTIITADEQLQVEHSVEQIINNPFVRPFFKNIDPDIQLLHQAIVLFTYDGVECKGAIDGLLINHKEKLIEPFDLKTTAKSVLSFPSVYFQLGYYLQGAFYVEGLKKIFETDADRFLDYYKLPKEILSYRIDYMKFIVVEKKKTAVSLPPYIYRTDEYLHNIGVKGGVINDKRYRGFEEYLEDWRFHNSTNFWEYSKEYLDAKGQFDLNVQ